MSKPIRLLLLLIFCLQFLFTPLVPITGQQLPAEDFPSDIYQRPAGSSQSAAAGDNYPGRIMRVEIQGRFSYPVVEQPGNNPGFVSEQPDTLTHFRLAQQYGTLGLMAHNTLAGARFTELHPGDQVSVSFTQEGRQTYWITEVRRFQALSPYSPYSDFIDLEDGSRYSASGLFLDVYGSGNDLVFQTCLKKNGDPSWGRLFVIATKIPSKYIHMGMFSGTPLTINQVN